MKKNQLTMETLKTMTKEEVYDFIRERLKFSGIAEHLRYSDVYLFSSKEHKRFDMSGYESKPGECTVNNQSIVNLFADLGIYDFTSYLFLDFHKGTPTLYLKYFHDEENLEFDFTGYGTTEIIYEIFSKTIFSDMPTRRRI